MGIRGQQRRGKGQVKEEDLTHSYVMACSLFEVVAALVLSAGVLAEGTSAGVLLSAIVDAPGSLGGGGVPTPGRPATSARAGMDAAATLALFFKLAAPALVRLRPVF